MTCRRTFSLFSAAVAVAVGVFVAAPVTSQMVSAASPPIQAVTPVRLADTRPGETTTDGKYAGIGARKPQSTTVIKIAGRANVPANATAVLLNLTDVQLTFGDNYLTVYPCTPSPPQTSNLNTPGGDIRANNVFVKLSSEGTVCVYSAHISNFVIDISGYVPAGGGPIAVNPARLFDSRPGEKTVDGRQAGGGRLKADSDTQVQIAGRGGVPIDAEAAIINVTDVLPSGGNFLNAHPCGYDAQSSSGVNTPAGDIRANNLYVPLDEAGSVCVYTVQNTDLVVDVVGFVPSADSDEGMPVILSSSRFFDSRPDESEIYDGISGRGRVGARSTTEVQIAGIGSVPPDATDALINLTSVLPSTGNLLIAYQCGTSRPRVSTVNSPPNDIRANSAFVKLSAAGTVCIYSQFPTDFLIDVSGYAVVPPVPLRVGQVACGEPYDISSPLHYFDFVLDGTAELGEQNVALGGVAPYRYSASGLVGYTIDRDTGALTRTTATSGTVAFTLKVTDAAGHQVKLPATVTWEPTASVDFDYRTFLPNGQTVAGPVPINWGKAPFKYSWSGLAGVRVDPVTGAFSYATTSPPVPNENDLDELTVTDQTGRKLVIDVVVGVRNSWGIRVPERQRIVLGGALSTFDTNGWGQGPYSYALSGENASKFAINSLGQLSASDANFVNDLNRLVDSQSGTMVTNLNVTVTDVTGQKLTTPITVAVGTHRIAVSC